MHSLSAQLGECPIPFVCSSIDSAWPGWLFTVWVIGMLVVGTVGTLYVASRRQRRQKMMPSSRNAVDQRGMIVLNRSLGEAIRISDDVKVVILNVDREQVRFGVEAPPNLRISSTERD